MTAIEADLRQLPLLAALGVPGVPEPKGSMTPKLLPGGRIIMLPAYNRKRKDGTRSDGRERQERWKRNVTAAAVVYQAVTRRHVRDDEALAVEMYFYLPKPPSAPRSVTLPIRKPDVDKLARLVNDCLKNGGLIAEDARIVDLFACKRFAIGRQPGVDIFVRDAAGVVQGELLA